MDDRLGWEQLFSAMLRQSQDVFSHLWMLALNLQMYTGPFGIRINVKTLVKSHGEKSLRDAR